jgi:putative ABC transport system permease protein
LRNAQKIDPGFETKHEVLAFLNFGPLRYSPSQTEQVEQAITERVRALPMVVAVGMADTAPLSPNVSFTTFPEGADASDARNARLIPVTTAQPGYFAAMNMPILKGRDFDDHDDAMGAKVVVVNQALAENVWPGQDPLDKRLSFLSQPDKVTVVGVVATVKYQTLGEPPQPVMYFPMRQRAQANVTLHVRVSGDPNAATKSVGETITAVDPNLRKPQMLTVPALIEQILQPEYVEAELLGGFGFLALLLAAIGTYGVMSYSVGQRTQEIGIRMALGAQPRDVMRLMLGGGMAMVIGGIVAGLIVTMLLTHSLSSLLFGIGLFDPLSFFATAGLMIVVALIACWIPSRRAMRVSPIIALRYE